MLMEWQESIKKCFFSTWLACSSRVESQLGHVNQWIWTPSYSANLCAFYLFIPVKSTKKNTIENEKWRQGFRIKEQQTTFPPSQTTGPGAMTFAVIAQRRGKRARKGAMLAQLGLNSAPKEEMGLILTRQKNSETVMPTSLQRPGPSTSWIKHSAGGPCSELSAQDSA